MMIETNLFESSHTRRIVAQCGRYSLLEYNRDISVTPETAMTAYFASKMNVRKKQVIARLNNDGVILQAGAMQLMIGQVQMQTNVRGVTDLVKKFIASKVTGETAIKPLYWGSGLLVLEPTYDYIIFQDLNVWNGGMVIEDGMFLACDDSIEIKVIARSNLSSAVLGKEGLFNTQLRGSGTVVLESHVPEDELFVVDLYEDQIRIDGNTAIAWSPTLKFTVEKTAKSLIGSAVSGEGLVNVYRGTGRVLIAPLIK